MFQLAHDFTHLVSQWLFLCATSLESEPLNFASKSVETLTLNAPLYLWSGEIPFKCDVCNKRFTCASTLVVYKETNTGEKPYKCDVCKQRFTQTSHLTEHKRTHTAENPYECDVCEKRLARATRFVKGIKEYTQERNLVNVMYVTKNFQ